MKRLLFVLVLAAVAISGCMEKSPSGVGGADKNPDEIKGLALKSADNLSSYSLRSSVTQTMLLNGVGINATPENATTIAESAQTIASVNLTGERASASGSTKSTVEIPRQEANSSTSTAELYQIGNSTYVKNDNGNWTHLQDPRSAGEIWGSNNQVLSLVETINKSQLESAGSESVEGVDAYKLKVVPGKAENASLYNTAFGIAAKLTNYPMLVPRINSTELNETAMVEKTVWISKETYLPIKYQSSMNFSMTPELVGGMDPSTGQMKAFNQSVRLGKVSVSIETQDLYYDFDKPLEIAPPQEALLVQPIRPIQTSAASK